MNGINNINFTGIKNIGAVAFNRSDITLSNSLSFQLTDDYNGKDLTEFRKIIDDMTEKSYRYNNSEGPDIVNIECIRSNDNQVSLLLNGTPLKTEYKDLKMFSYLANLMDRISVMKNKDMVVNNDYKDYAADDILIYKYRISDNIDTSDPKFFDRFFDRELVRNVAKGVGKFIEKIMFAYLDIE